MRTGFIKGAGGYPPLSKIVLGCCDFGTRLDEAASFRLLDMYYDAGGRTLDTARVYASWVPGGESASERTIGRWLKSRNRREEMTVVTKGGHPPLTDMSLSRLSPEELASDLEESLAALDTDYIDVYFLHRDDVNLPLSGIMDTLDRFVRNGQVRALGASNWSLERIQEANAYALSAGKAPFAVSQIQWSLAVCTPAAFGDGTLCCMDGDAYAGYLAAGLPVMAYSAQAKGIFSKLLAGEKPSGSFVERLTTPENRLRLERLRLLRAETGYSAAALSTAYIVSQKLDGYAVISASRPEQLADTLTASDLVLTAAQIAFLEGK